MSLFADPSIRKIAIANPQHAPYGRAAVAALQKAGVYDQVAGRLVLGENIAQAAQFVESGNADAGLIAMSLALSPSLRASGRWVEVPADLYPPIRQSAVVLALSTRQAQSRQFLAFLTSPEVVALFQRSGFGAAK
jgi:molybdate transport system substrate-binding protein